MFDDRPTGSMRGFRNWFKKILFYFGKKKLWFGRSFCIKDLKWDILTKKWPNVAYFDKMTFEAYITPQRCELNIKHVVLYASYEGEETSKPKNGKQSFF